MLFWFVGTAVLSVRVVFGDSRFDYRFLVLGALLPDVIDLPFGGARVLHSVVGSIAVLVVVMLSTVGRRLLRRRLLALPIGMMIHLIFDGAFTNNGVFWWPFSGFRFEDAPWPTWERGPWSILLEVVGIGLCAWIVQRFGLRDADRRSRFVRTGILEPC